MKSIPAAIAAVLAAMALAPHVAQATPTMSSGQRVAIDEIIINEAFTNGPNGAMDEYIEFQNVTDSTIDISDYALRFTVRGVSSVIFARWPVGMQVEPGELFMYMGIDFNGTFCRGLYGSYDIPDSGIISLHKPNGEYVTSISVPQNPPVPRTPCE